MELVRPHVRTWSDSVEWPGRPGRRYSRNGFVLTVPDHGVVALVDPPALATVDRDALKELGAPTHVLLTCGDHLREADAHRRGAEILAHPLAGVDSVAVGDREVLWGAVEAIHLPYVHSRGETAFLADGVLVVGDALCGGRADIGVPDGEIGIFSTRHIEDPSAARRSLARLLELRFEALCFGHGTPVLRKPHDALRRFLAREDVWGPR